MKHRTERQRESRRLQKRRAYARKHPFRRNIFKGSKKSEFWNIVLSGYGQRCNCCGETTRLFLQLDHVNNDGNLEKRINGKRLKTEDILRKAIRNNFPSCYQILCANCNHGKERNGGVCPHVEIKTDPLAHRRSPNNRTSHYSELPLFS